MNFIGAISAVIFLTLLIGGITVAAKEEADSPGDKDNLTAVNVYVILFIAVIIWGLGYLSNI